MEIIKNEFLHKTPVLPLVTRHKKKKGNGFSTIPFAMSPPGFEPGTPRLKV
jgi:hypothetical protein